MKEDLTLEEIDKLIQLSGTRCRWCEGKLSNIKYYRHEGGHKVKDYPFKVWLYWTCQKCGHQWSLPKLLRSPETSPNRD